MPAVRVSGIGRTIRHQGDELRIVQDVDLLLVPGVAIGITGPLDAGWRSLLRLIVGLDPTTSGTVEIVGRPGESPRAPVREELRQDVVLASALDPMLDRDLGETARGLARIAASRRRRVRPCSARAIRDAAAVAEGRPAASLSHSERLRMCVALAASLSPSHILLEIEPKMATLDERRLLVAQLRRVLDTGVGLAIGTRDEILLAALAKSVLIFEDGRVLAEGTPESVLPAALAEARREGLR
jgi:ABC-type hemin transport system ATPase subunit